VDIPISLTVNGKSVTKTVDSRTLLVQFLRETLQLTGTHVGCDTAQCGACTVHMNGRAIKSCSMLAAQVQGSQITTIEGLAKNGELHPMQAAFRECHGLQCGYCTPGMVMSAVQLLADNPKATEEEIREGLDGNAVKSCTILAAQANGAQITTIEGLAEPNGELHPMQAAFKDCHGLQCGFCTPGMVLSAVDLVKRYPDADEATIREQLEGNICRCTGYQNIVKAIAQGAAAMRR